jgi:nucleotide-binding universal stress UspA family protein
MQTLNHLHLQTQTQIILTHVLPTAQSHPTPEPDVPTPTEDSLYQLAQEQLQAYQAQIPGAKIEIARGDAAQEIIRLAHIYQADLIIIGSRGLQGVDRILADSVSSQVVAEAACSVFVVKNN